ncbi:MAG: hypothetical protein HZB23_08545 [Deltaproteobacteria bacterium]|nr:hypothetical protein [Deltaproteobacteria bacterium]
MLDINGFTYLVDKEFMEQAKPIKIDFSPMGFELSSGLEIAAGGCKSGSCGGSCG